MAFEVWLLRWTLWTLMIALALGGVPWKFPGNGKFWLESVQRPDPSENEGWRRPHRAEGNPALQGGVGPLRTEGRGPNPVPTLLHPSLQAGVDSKKRKSKRRRQARRTKATKERRDSFRAK